jgi:hypothetical protein
MTTQSANSDRGISKDDPAVRWILGLAGIALLVVVFYSLFWNLPGAFYVRGYGAAILVGSLLAIWPARGLGTVDRVVEWVATGGGLILVAIMLLTVVDVTLRKFSGNGSAWLSFFLSDEVRATIKPIKGATELSQMGLAIAVACALGYGARTGAHVAVDILGMVGGRIVTRWTDIVIL